MPIRGASKPVQARSCLIGLPGARLRRCTGIKRGATGCAPRWSFHCRPFASTRKHLAAATAARYENPEPDCNECEPGPSIARARQALIVKLVSPYPTIALQGSLQGRSECLRSKEVASLARSGAGDASTDRAHSTKASPGDRNMKRS